MRTVGRQRAWPTRMHGTRQTSSSGRSSGSRSMSGWKPSGSKGRKVEATEDNYWVLDTIQALAVIFMLPAVWPMTQSPPAAQQQAPAMDLSRGPVEVEARSPASAPTLPKPPGPWPSPHLGR